MDLLWAIIIGGVAGWLAGLVMTGRGFGVIGNIGVGIIGAVLGYFVLTPLGLTANFFWQALLGSIVLLLVAGFFRRPAL